MDKQAIRSTLLCLLFLLGVKGIHKATVGVIPASDDGIAVLQCYTYGMLYPECFPTDYNSDQKNCTTVWMKDEKVLNSDDRFDISSRISYNFCDTFPDTGAVVSDLGLSDAASYNRFECFVSTLTIKKVQESDFGTYQCNYSDHKPDPRHEFQHLANVTLVNITDYILPEPKVELVVNNIIEESDGEEHPGRLVQCISVGKPLDWYYILGQSTTTSCDQECLFKRFGTKLSSLVSEDMWRCFELTNVTHQPYSNVYESFLFLTKFCKFDTLRVRCGSADGKIVDAAHTVHVYEPYYDDMDRMDDYHVEAAINIAAVVIAVVVGSLLIGFSIWAWSRLTCGRYRIAMSY